MWILLQGGQVVQQSGIQFFNCKEFGHYAKECRKPKRVKDSTYHKEKMLLCKQAEKGVQLQAEQSDWLADTDEEIDEQELEAHYSYMAKIQEVPNADSGTDAEPLEQVQYDTDDNVFANDIQHFEQSESITNTCAVETGDSNVIPDSPDMCDNDIQDDQNDVECDDERVALANLIANLKLDVDENKKIQKQLKKANATLTQELTECKSILAETSRTLRESNSIRDSCLVALQNKQTELEEYMAFNNRTVDYEKLEHKLNETLGLLAQKEIDIKEGLKVKAYEISVVKEKHDELVKQSLLTKSHYEGLVKEKTKVITDLKLKEEKDIDKMISMENQIKFLNEIVYKRSQSIQTIHMLAPKCPTFNGRPTFANLMYLKKAQYEKPCLYKIQHDHSDPANRLIPDREEILTLKEESRSKLNKDLVKSYDYTRENSLYEIFKPPTQLYEIQFAQANEIRKKMWRKSFVKTKPNIFKNIDFLPVSKSISKSRQAYNVMTNNINHLKEIVDQEHGYVESFEDEIDELESDKAEFSNMYDMLLQECVSNDICNFECLNVVCANFPCGKCVFNLNHDACVSKFLNDVNARTKKPNVVPISTRKPKSQANKSVATPHKKTVASESTTINSKSYYRMLYKKTSKAWKWWIAQQCPSAYTWVPKTKKKWVPKVRNESVTKKVSFAIDNVSRITNVLKLTNTLGSNLSCIPSSSNSLADCITHPIHYLVQGNITINRVYYVEGLNHNLFSVGQFCDADSGETTSSTPICLMAKASPTQACSFKSKTVLSLKGRLNLLHMDFCGPMRVASINGKRYILKSSSPVIFVRTDRGTEFLNKTLNAFFKEEGIEHQNSTPRTPKQNGVLERRNCTLVEVARMMLSAFKLPLCFWAEVIATACYTQNRSIIILTHEKMAYHIINDRKPSIKHLHIFGCTCYLTRDSENLDKMKEIGDPCILVGYSTQSKGYRVYNKRTRLIVESIHLRFDEIKEMSETSVANDTSGLVPQRQKASDYDNPDPAPELQNVSPSADTTVPSQQELDLLFGPLYDEFFNDGTSRVNKSSSPTDNSIQKDTLPSTHIQPTSEPTTPTNVHAEENNDNQAEFTNPFCTPVQENAESSSRNIGNSNVHTFNQPQDSEYRWTKDHPLTQVRGNPSKPVQTRRQLATDPEMCMFALTVSIVEPKNIKEAMADSAWIEAMQEELHQFDRLQVWELVDKPFGKNVQLPVVLERANIFQKNGIDPSKYTITLAHGLSLDVDDPVDVALAYREKMVRFF
ncbi:retrovirus-related pol polyprotein from transposon TNT 1-94 [Tanacetum coccineum]|uniref:Retrovirus-related pol polyprotein from transposon TNT 1-94 n=1 Tax=Tanacetum coccineum TaxID=301880 RepID=A0ABQ5EDT6_9ASTR